MKLRKVNPNKIKIPEIRVTARFDDDTWEQFQKSLKEIGAVAPIICCQVDEKLVLVDGLHRLVEAQRNGAATIDVAVIDGDMVDVLTKNLFLDHMRGKTPVSEMVNVIEALWKEYQLDSEKIAEKTGLTRDYVEKLQLISQLTPMCRQELDDGLIAVGHAVALTKIKDPIQQEVVLNQLLTYRWKVKEFEKYVNDVLVLTAQQAAAPVSATPPKPATVKCHFCKIEYEPSEIAGVLICPPCAGTLFSIIGAARAEIEKDKNTKTAGQNSIS